MTSRQRELERLEDEYLAQVRSFRQTEEYFSELRQDSNRHTQDLEDRLLYLTSKNEKDYTELYPYLSKIHQIHSDFHWEMNQFETILADKEADYRREYSWQRDELERRLFEEE